MIIFKINGTFMKKVYKVYDKIFDWFDQHRNKDLMESYYLNLILDNVPAPGYPNIRNKHIP